MFLPQAKIKHNHFKGLFSPIQIFVRVLVTKIEQNLPKLTPMVLKAIPLI